MLEARQTPAFHAMAPRPLSEHEVAVIRAWGAKAKEQLWLPCTAANQDEVMEQLRTHDEILARLDNRGKPGSELRKEATQRK